MSILWCLNNFTHVETIVLKNCNHLKEESADFEQNIACINIL